MIRNEYMVTWKLYREWLLENKTKGAKLVFLVFWSLMAIVLFVMSFFGGLSWFYLFMAVFCVYRAFFRDYIAARKQYAQLVKIYGCESWLRTITLSDTGIMLEEGNSSMQWLLRESAAMCITYPYITSLTMSVWASRRVSAPTRKHSMTT